MNYDNNMSKDITNSSISLSEGEDADLEGIAGRVAELEDILHGKEAVVEALNAEIDNLRDETSSPNSIRSHNSSIQYTDTIITYHEKFQEYIKAIKQRDDIIEDLTLSLQKALSSRDSLIQKINVLETDNSEKSDKDDWEEKISNLSNGCSNQIEKLECQYKEAKKYIQELEKDKEYKNSVLLDYKQQIQILNQQIQDSASINNNASTNDFLTIKKQYESQIEKIKKDMKTIIEKFSTETSASQSKHEQEIHELKLKYEAEISQLKEENKHLEIQQSKELTKLQSQLVLYKETMQSLREELTNNTNTLAKDKNMLNEQISLQKLQIEELTLKYTSAVDSLQSKESIDQSLKDALQNIMDLKKENEGLKFKLDDLSIRYSAAQNLIDNNQAHERTLSNKIFSLEKTLSRVSGISYTELDETVYQTFDEMSLQYQIAQKKLDEKAELENQLKEKIQNLENVMEKTKQELAQANGIKEDYEKQIKNLKNMCDKLKSELHVENLEDPQSVDSLDSPKQTNLEQELLSLRNAIEKRDKQNSEYVKRLEELNNVNKKLQSESDKLKQGLAAAWSQCAEFEEKLDQTLAVNDSKLDGSSLFLEQTFAANSFEVDQILDRPLGYDKVIKKLDICRNQLEQLEQEKLQLLKEKEELLNNFEETKKQYEEKLNNMDLRISEDKKDLEIKHTQEMEDLKKYFEQKWLQVAKEYSEEIFSQQLKKMSDNDSDIEELPEDLYIENSMDCVGAGGDNLNISCKIDEGTQVSLSNGIVEENITEDKLIQISTEYEKKLKFFQNQVQEAKENAGRTTLLKAVNQALLTVDSESDDKWPNELLELRNKFTCNMKREIQALKERHSQEIALLKEEKNCLVQELQKEIQEVKSINQESFESNLIQERDTLYKTCVTLKNLVEQLIMYFTECEEEVNNILMNDNVKKLLLLMQMENKKAINEFDTNDEKDKLKAKKVHFALQSSEIASLVNSNSDLNDLINDKRDILQILKNDIDECRQRLKTELSQTDLEAWLSKSDNQDIIDEINSKIMFTMEKENNNLKTQILEMQEKLSAVKNKKEIISEGYGEQDNSVCEETNSDFSELQERAKFVVMNGSNDTAYLLQLIDGFCRYRDMSIDELEKEKQDLQHQQVSLDPSTPKIHKVHCVKIEAADKQLKSNRKFQEEQAFEREAERDEAAKQIENLQEKLKERDREKDRDYRITSDETWLSPAPSSGSSTLEATDVQVSVETLTSQLKELETKKIECENELKDAVDKIWVLREVITDLEQQVQNKSEKEESLQNQIEQYEQVIIEQTKNQQELIQELENLKAKDENNELNDHIDNLQEELRKHQLSSEQFTNSSALKQMKIEFKELQSQLDKKTKELETLHVCGSSLSLSQPSEDISIREQIDATRCSTPDDLNIPLILPLDSLLKLKETLQKHFRAEDVALKRLKDLDIQLSGMQRQNEELQAEQELLQQTTSEQLFQIETLKARLEQQKQNAPYAQQKATCNLQAQLYDVNDKLEIAERTVTDKNLELQEIREQLDRVNKMLSQKENEIANVVQSESKIIQKLRDQLQIIEEENKLMKAMLDAKDKNHQDLPQLIDSMLADKNEEIDHLKDQLTKKEKQLELYLSLNLDDMQIKEFLRQNEQKNSARTLSDILSINSECEEVEAIREAPNFTRSQNVSNFRLPHSTLINSKRDTVDYSSAVILEVPEVPHLELGSSTSPKDSQSFGENEMISEQQNLISLSNDNFICPRHGNASQDDSSSSDTALAIQELEKQLYEIRDELVAKNEALKSKEIEIAELQNNLKLFQESIATLNKDKNYYKQKYEDSMDSELKIKKDLEQVENKLKLVSEEMESYRDKIVVNEKILIEEADRAKRNQALLQEREQEVKNLNDVIQENNLNIENLKKQIIDIENYNKELQEFKSKSENVQRKLSKCQTEIQRLSDSLNNRDQIIHKLEEMARKTSYCGESSQSDKDQEIYHLQEYLKEKDKVIQEMNDDSKSLQKSLEIIQRKMKESGNVFELRKKLKEERKLNAELKEQISKLKKSFRFIRQNKTTEDNEIEEMIQRELDLSARLDQQLLNVIDSDSEEVFKKCENLTQANKELKGLNTLKNDLEIDNEMLKSQIHEYENRIMQLNSELEDKTMKLIRLKEDFSRDQQLIRNFQLQYQKEKNASQENQNRDTELINQLRIKLNESLDEKEQLVRKLRASRHQITEQSSLANKQYENFDADNKILSILNEKLEFEKRKNLELQDSLKKIELDKASYEKQVEVIAEENDRLQNNIALLQNEKMNLESNLLYLKEELEVKTMECDLSQPFLKSFNDSENKRNQQKSEESIQVKNLRQELNNTKKDMSILVHEMKDLKDKLSASSDREFELSCKIESILERESKLRHQLSIANIEETRLSNIIEDQKKEIQAYLKKEIGLLEELKKSRFSTDKPTSPSKILNRIKELNKTVEKLSMEKHQLYEKISNVKEESDTYLQHIKFLESQLNQKVLSQQMVTSNGDKNERLNYFYGKYLRSESRCRALTWQKRYLMCVLAGYQTCQENTLVFLSQLTSSERLITTRGPNNRNARWRFRSVVLLLIGVQRMKWLILRWRSGKKVGANIILGNNDNASVVPRSFVNSTGHSPPVKDRYQWK